jgi:hypothetical protein
MLSESFGRIETVAKREKVFGIPGSDRADAKQQLEEWRGQRNDQRQFDVRSDHGMIVVMVLFRPVGFDAGLCVRLVRDPVRSFVWLLTLIGYPAVSGRAHFKLRWTHKDGTIKDTEDISVYATAAEVAYELPAEVQELAVVQGGTMPVTYNGSVQQAQTGRWFVSFEDKPQWTPKFMEMSDPRLQGMCEIHDMKPSGRFDRFRTLASISGPMPIHPGSMAIGWNNSGVLRLGPVECRIYQEYAGGVATAQYSWRISPFTVTQFEGETIQVDIDLLATNQDERDGTVELSVAVQIDYGDGVTADDFTGTLDDWILAAIASDDSFSYAAGRLTVTLNPDEDRKVIQMDVPTLNDGLIEGTQLFTIRLLSARASTGVIMIEQSECNVTLADKNAATFSLTGPSVASAPSDVEYTISVDGLFQPESTLGVTIFSTGTTTEEDSSNWNDAIEAIVGQIDGASFDRLSGRLTITTVEQGGIGAIPITVGFFASAAGKEFGLTLASPEVAGGAAELGDSFEVTTELKSAAVFSIDGDESTYVPGDAEFTLSISGLFRVGALLSVRIGVTGSSLDTDRTDWMDAVEIAVSPIGGAAFDRGSQRITIRMPFDGEVSSIPIAVGFFESAAGKTFGLALSSPELLNGEATLDASTVTTNLWG